MSYISNWEAWMRNKQHNPEAYWKGSYSWNKMLSYILSRDFKQERIKKLKYISYFLLNK